MAKYAYARLVRNAMRRVHPGGRRKYRTVIVSSSVVLAMVIASATSDMTITRAHSYDCSTYPTQQFMPPGKSAKEEYYEFSDWATERANWLRLCVEKRRCDAADANYEIRQNNLKRQQLERKVREEESFARMLVDIYNDAVDEWERNCRN